MLKHSIVAIFLCTFYLLSSATSNKRDVIHNGLDDDDSDEDFDFDETRSTSKLDPNLKKLYLAWNNFDLCKEVSCKANEYCVTQNRAAKCVKKKYSGLKQHRRGEKYLRNDRSSTESSTRAEKQCQPCPVVRPDFICGSDNSTYSSECRLDFHNCVHTTNVQISCKGFCPCKTHLSKVSSRRQKLPWSRSQSKGHHSKIPSSILESKVTHIPNKSALSKHQCSQSELNVMGVRLLDWFSVLLKEQLRKGISKKKQKLFKLPDCKPEISWMFHHLDVDGDLKLSLKELYDLDNDKREKCLKPYLDSCNEDKDLFISAYEWCTCFDRSSKPCHSAHLKSNGGLLGAYVPQCDHDGFYTSTQCHGSTGMCWCVDKNGVEFTNTRRRGSKPDCEGMLNRAKHKNVGYNLDDEDSDFESSGDDQMTL